MQDKNLRDDLISFVIPAKNEGTGLSQILPRLRQLYPHAEVIVVNDLSTDNTLDVCRSFGATVISHPYSMGNGAAIKTGVRVAKGQLLVLMDADGQHDPGDIPKLLTKLAEGYDMVVGARHRNTQANIGRMYANFLYNHLASWMVNQKIEDLTSGFRVVKADKFSEFLHLLPNGFSYPTTITMAFFRAGYAVGYVPIEAKPRKGKSHINIMRDGFRFLLIIFKVGTLYSPLKLFVPISFAFFITALSYYGYTFINYDRFTNMSGLLFTTSVLIFLIGLVSEQITNLVFSRNDRG
ncbi:MAG: glycosyltransferase family 2 protein [Sulfuricaulis sp.]